MNLTRIRAGAFALVRRFWPPALKRTVLTATPEQAAWNAAFRESWERRQPAMITKLMEERGLTTGPGRVTFIPLAALALILLPSLALAQGAPVYQSGQMRAPHNVAKITRNGQIQDGGGLTGDANSRGVNPFRVLDSNGQAICTDATTGGNYFCLGHDSAGNPVFNVNGTDFAFGGFSSSTLTGLRTNLTATQNLYVATTGADSGTCAVASPCLTIQYALNQALAAYDARAHAINVNVAAGTYTGTIRCSGNSVGSTLGATNPAYITVLGAGSGTTTVSTVDHTVVTANGCYLGLAGLKLQSSGGNTLFPQIGGVISVNSDINFGPAAADQMHAEVGGIIYVTSGYTISGNAANHVSAILGGEIIFTEINKVVTCTGSPAFGTAFAYVAQNGFIYQNSVYVSFSGCGGVTGTRYQAWSNGTIETIGGLGTYFPGSITGFDAWGGTYAPLAKPSFAVTGFGAAPTIAVGSGATPRAGTFTVTTGAGPAASGTISLATSTPLGQYGQVCSLLIDYPAGVGNAQQWPSTSVYALQGHTPTDVSWNWSTGAGALVTPGVYKLAYLCAGLSGFP